jgi:hypothetical protein
MKVSSKEDAVLLAVSWDGAHGGATGAVIGAKTLPVRARLGLLIGTLLFGIEPDWS